MDGIYENIDSIKGALHDKLLNDKENAYISYDIATIEKNVPMEIDMGDTLYKEPDYDKLNSIYEELEFYSFLKKVNKIRKEDNIDYIVVDDVSVLEGINECAVFLETIETNYHNTDIIGMGVYSNLGAYFIQYSILKSNPLFLLKTEMCTYDAKKLTTALKWHDIYVSDIKFDTMIAGYLLEYNLKEDIAYLANEMGFDIEFRENLYPKKEEIDIDKIARASIAKAKFIYETKDTLIEELKKEDLYSLFTDIELPLSSVLGAMEYNGIHVDEKILRDMGEEIKIKIELISNTIYNYAGCEFNISSPIQLGEILFDKLGLPHSKKGKNGYSTAADVLDKLIHHHPIIEAILEYRMLTKLHSTYIEGLINMIMSDGKIHTIYTQTLTRTGRLSSIEPNLQNIPIRHEYGRLIRKAFVASNESLIVSSDYSQIELRILAHIAEVESLIEAFKDGMDIHTKTAMDIYSVEEREVTKDMRRAAKAVNFGIIYGISSYGLSENIGVNPREASEFIKSYLDMYPGVKKYMDDTIADAHEVGYVRTLFNRKRTIPELANKNYMIRSGAERMALNTPIQGTSADIIKKAMVEIDRELKKKGLETKMIIQVHDELVFDCPEGEIEDLKTLIKEVMENTCTLKVPLKIEIEYGKDWYQAK